MARKKAAWIGRRDESQLKSRLMERSKTLLPEFIFIRHEDRLTAGIPDLSATGNLATSWWEVKHATPDFDTSGIQELTMLRLARAGGKAYYLIYDESEEDRTRTVIVRPKQFKNWTTDGIWTKGLDHDWVIEQIKRVHNGDHRIFP